MLEIKENGVIKVSQGDTFTLNVFTSMPFHTGDKATLTVKDELDTTNVILEKEADEYKKIKLDNDKKCCCSNNQYFKDSDYADMVVFKFSSLETSKEPGQYYYDIQFDFKTIDTRYTVMWPTKFIIMEDVTNNVFEMADLVIPPVIEEGEENDPE